MMCMTEIHGGVCYRISTPHKSGNNMKEKKKKKIECYAVFFKRTSNLEGGRVICEATNS